MKFYVIDADDLVSWFASDTDPSTDGPEHFDTEEGAIERAKELAHSSPGADIYVAKAIKVVSCAVGSSEIQDV